MSKVLTTLLVSFVAFSAHAEFKAGFIDMQKAIQSTKAGKNAKSALEKEFDKKKKSLQAQESELKKKAEDFEKKKMVLSDKVRETKGRELQQEMLKFREELQKSQLAMRQKEMEMTKPILEKMQKVIGDVAKAQGLSMVFERGQDSVMWAKADLDITDEVVKKYNKYNNTIPPKINSMRPNIIASICKMLMTNV